MKIHKLIEETTKKIHNKILDNHIELSIDNIIEAELEEAIVSAIISSSIDKSWLEEAQDLQELTKLYIEE